RAWTERGYEHRQRVSKGGRYDLVPRGPATCVMVALDWLNVSNPSTRKAGSSEVLTLWYF
ncbi:MAG: hypothetical protein ACI835_004949, partial [Planctomycetota bacterium]